MQMREFHIVSRLGKTRVWKIGVQGDQVVTEFGELGGKMQRVADTGQEKNVGRSNYVSPEKAAIEQMERQILKQTRSGYVELGSEGAKITSFEEMDLSKDLPGNLRFYKPDNSLSKRMEKMLEKGDAWLSRKRDGEMVVIFLPIGAEYPVIYSRNMLKHHHLEEDSEWSHRFTHICDEIYNDFGEIPGGTLLLGEMVSGPELDDRWKIATIMKTLTPESIKFQEEHGKAHFCCWDIAFWGGEDWVSTLTIRERYQTIHKMFDGARFIVPVEHYAADEIEDGLSAFWDARYDDTWREEYDKMEADGTIKAQAMLFAKIQDWEGFVVIDPDGEYGDSAYNFRGKTDRPGKYCCKLKPLYDDDFIAFFDPEGTHTGEVSGKWGRGKRQGQVGSVALYQYDSSGVMHYICDCGGGIIKTDEFAEEFSDPALYPLVVEVLYNGRTFKSKGDDTNALQFPRVSRVRHDKEADECINEEL